MSAGLVLTNAGSAEIEAAYQTGETVKITVCSIGDGSGSAVTVDPSATALKGRFGQVPLSAGESFDGMIGGTAIIPCADYPGRVVREFGLESESGTLIAYGAYPDTYLPSQSDSIVKELIVRFVMPLVHAENVTLIVDPNIAIVTQEEGDKRYYRRSLRLQEVQDEGTEAQQELRENIGCGTSATKDVVTSPTDTTAGRVPTVGWEGLGAVSGVKYTDANTPNVNCFVIGDAAAIHGPFANAPFNILQFQYDANAGQQIGYRAGVADAQMYHRSKTGAVWGNWIQVFDKLHPPTAADTGAVDKAGDTMTGRLIMNVDGEAIRLKPKTAGVASYIISIDSANANHWYVGAGSNNNADTVFNNYKGGNNSVILRADGTVNINPTQLKYAVVNGNLAISSPAPIIQLAETDTGKNYFLVVDASGIRLDEDSTASNNNVWSWSSPANTFTVNGQVIPTNYANFDARYGGGKTTTGTNNAYYTHANGVVFMQAVRSIAVGNNATVTVTLPTSFPNGILGVGASFYGTGGQDQDSYYLCTPVGKNQVTINTHNCNGTFSLIVSGY